MRLLQPFIEVFHEARGTVSKAQRSAAETLRLASPRSPEIAQEIARLHAPWWGFAVYGVAYAITVMAIVALLASVALASALRSVAPSLADNWIAMFWIAAALTAPLSIWPFRIWVQRRRREVLEVARMAHVVKGEIIGITLLRVNQIPFVRQKASTTYLTIACMGPAGGKFKGHIAQQPGWAVVGQPIEMLALASSHHAIALLPTGGTRPLLRDGSMGQHIPPGSAGLPQARVVR